MATYLVLDDLAGLAPGGSIYVVDADGVALPMMIASIDANVAFLTEPVEESRVPQPESVFAMEYPELQHQLFRVIGIRESGVAQYEFTAIKYEPGKQAYIENGLVIQPKITTALIPYILPSPTNLRIGANSRAGVNNSTAVVVAQWDESPNAEHYELQWRKDAGVYSPVQKIYGTVCEYENAFSGTYEFKITAVNKSKTSPPAFSPLVTIGNITQAPISEQLQIIASVAGVLTIDCSLYKNFKATLTENTTVEFINVPQTKDVSLQVTNTGAFTLTFPASVNAGAYTGPAAAGSDLVLLKTINFGANWSFNSTALSAGGSFGVLIDPDYVAFAADGTPQPITATVIGGTAPFTYAWTRTDTNGGTDFTFSSTSVEDPNVTVTIAGTTNPGRLQTWKLTVTDSTAATAEANVTLDAYNPNYQDNDPWCLAADSYMHAGNRAWEVRAGDEVGVWDRNVEAPGVATARVVNNQLGRQPIYRLVTASGKSCRVSATTPIELRDGRVVMSTEMHLEDIVVCDTLTNNCYWEQVAAVNYMGIGSVAKISAGDTVLLGGDNPRYMLGTHNIRWKPDDAP